ncbi:hypothetical protein C0992_006713 [Termitomyces sp. T32_za158]|nr:hypothetical protein C0992_006713 [Termitomyces sp. T32_za158]
MENWWSQNKEVFDAHGLYFKDHACITSSRGKLKGGVHLLEEEYRESEEARQIAGKKTNGIEDKREIGGPSRSEGVTLINLGLFGKLSWTPRAVSNEVSEAGSESTDKVIPELYHQSEGQKRVQYRG